MRLHVILLPLAAARSGAMAAEVLEARSSFSPALVLGGDMIGAGGQEAARSKIEVMGD